MVSQIDRNLFLNTCSLRAARQQRKRLMVTVLAGGLFSLGALTTLQAASESSGQMSTRPSLHGGSSRLLSEIGAAGFGADTLPYALLANAPTAEKMAEPVAASASVEPAAQEAATATAPEATASSAEAARAAIDQWAKAWQSKDVAGYLASYGEGFQPANGMSRDDWAKLRRQRIADKHVIQLELRDIDVQPEAADRVRVNFTQDYRADQFVERGTAKSMLLVLEKDGWRIAAEESGR